MRVGVVGCGNISGVYLRALAESSALELAAVCDRDRDRAEAAAAGSDAQILSLDQLLGDDSIDTVLNLTTPDRHYEVSHAANHAGKHVYSEKPLASTFEQGERLLADAAKSGVTVGCAPDTVLGAGHQACRRAVASGALGRPVGASLNMLCSGHEAWHPNARFYYEPGGGPLFDMGPYYLTALVCLLGPIAWVQGAASIVRGERVLLSGEAFAPTTPTHIVATLGLERGALATLAMSFEVARHSLPMLEIYGTEGTLSCPDPNCFVGPVALNGQDLEVEDATHDRGVGLEDMALAIREGIAPRCSAELALHVLEAMEAVLKSAEGGNRIELRTRTLRPEPMPQ